MSKKYIQNMTKATIVIQDTKLNTVVKLAPYTCSNRNFSEEYLEELPYVEKLLSLGKITLQDTKTHITVKKSKDYGQKYSIGTRCYLNGESNLDLEVESYNPSADLYTVKIVKTGGRLKVKENSLSMTKYVGKKVDVDVDEFGELTETNQKDLSLPQKQNPVDIVYSEDNGLQQAVSAADLIKSQDKISEQIANQKVDIVYKTDEEAKQEVEDDEEIFLVKSDKDVFSKEVTASELIKNTGEAVQKEVKKLAERLKPAKKEESRSAQPDEAAFVNLSEDLQQYITDFMSKDSRNKKLIISRLKDTNKLKAIITCGDDMSKQAAKSRLEKLNV